MKRTSTLYKAHNGICYYCNKPVLVGCKPKKSKLHLLGTIEHLYPRGDIRRNVDNKTVLACSGCNSQKNIEFLTALYADYDGQSKYSLNAHPNLLINLLQVDRWIRKLNKQMNYHRNQFLTNTQSYERLLYRSYNSHVSIGHSIVMLVFTRLLSVVTRSLSYLQGRKASSHVLQSE
jgi:hypothetical protein